MRIVIVGGGEIGFALAEALADQHEVFVVDHAPHIADRFERLDVQFVLGAGTSADVLTRAGIEEAEVLVACTGLDEVNIVASAMARQLAKPRTVCFVSREDFTVQDQRGRAPFGIDRVVWPEAELAAHIERIIRAREALDAGSFVGGAIRLLEYRLDEGSALAGRRIADLHLPHGSLIVAVRRGDALFIPRGSSELAVGDKAVFMGTPEALQDVRLRVGGSEENRRQRVTIVGGGDVGFQLAQRLDAGEPVDMIVIERDVARGEMIKAYVGVVVIATAVIAVFLVRDGISYTDALRHGAFQVISILTTTGFASVDFQLWNDQAKMVLFLLMFIGGCAGSAAGGPKVVRHLLMARSTLRELTRTLHPRAVLPVKLGGRVVPEHLLRDVQVFILFYLLTFSVGTAVVVLLGADLVTGLSASIACLGNIGPGFEEIGPMASFAHLHPVSKIVLTLEMWIGRLEVITVLVLFRPEAWRSARWGAV